MACLPGKLRPVQTGRALGEAFQADVRFARVHACKLLTRLCRNVVHFHNRFPDQFCGHGKIAI